MWCFQPNVVITFCHLNPKAFPLNATGWVNMAYACAALFAWTPCCCLQCSGTPWRCPVVQLGCLWLFAIFPYAMTMSSCAVVVSLIICNFPGRHDDVQLCSCGVFDYLQFSRTPSRCPVVQLWCLWLFAIFPYAITMSSCAVVVSLIICNFPVRHDDVQLCSEVTRVLRSTKWQQKVLTQLSRC